MIKWHQEHSVTSLWSRLHDTSQVWWQTQIKERGMLVGCCTNVECELSCRVYLFVSSSWLVSCMSYSCHSLLNQWRSWCTPLRSYFVLFFCEVVVPMEINMLVKCCCFRAMRLCRAVVQSWTCTDIPGLQHLVFNWWVWVLQYWQAWVSFIWPRLLGWKASRVKFIM